MQIKNIVKKILVIYLSVLLAGVTVNALISYLNNLERIDRELIYVNTNGIKNVDKSIENMLSAIDKNIIYKADSYESIQRFLQGSYNYDYERTENLREIQKLIFELMGINSAVDDIYVYSENMDLVVSSGGVRKRSEFPDLSWYNNYKNEKKAYSVNGLCIMRTVPMMFEERSGALIIKLSKTQLENTMNSYLSGKTVTLLDKDNNVLAGDEWVAGALKDISSANGYEKVKHGGKKYILFYRVSENLGWKFVTVENVKDAYELRSQNTRSIALVSVITLIMAVFVFLWADKRTLVPVENLENNMKENIDYIKSKIIMDLLNGSAGNYEDIRKKLSYFNISFGTNNFMVMLIEGNKNLYSNEQLLAEIQALICELCGSGMAVFEGKRRIACVMNFVSPSREEAHEISETAADYIRTMLSYDYDISLRIGIGDFVKDMADIGSSYNQAGNALRYCLTAETNPIITFNDMKLLSKEDYESISETISGIIKNVDLGEYVEAKKRSEHMFEIMRKNGLTLSYIRQFALQIITEVYGLSGSEWEISQGDAISMILSSESAEKIERDIYKILDSCKKTNPKQQEAKRTSNPIIAEMLEYVDKNYKNPDFSLSHLAETFHYSTSYLSRIFKSELGINFMEYLLGRRMEAAKKLLEETDLSVNDIAAEVGYSNYTSFIKTFKKFFGVTPSDQRTGAHFGNDSNDNQ